MIRLKCSEKTEFMEKREKCLEWLRGHCVRVGLPASASARSRFLLAVHTRGSPLMRIPPRPVVKPALAREELRAELAEHLAEACAAAFDGSLPGVRAGLEKAGPRGADGIREYIDAGIDPPNAPVTLSGGWIRNRVSGKGVPVKGKSGTTPLVDTGQLYGEFGYEITER